nr:hypothetical protein Iba_scaffold1393CG0600 [Ipomoea batatas]
MAGGGCNCSARWRCRYAYSGVRCVLHEMMKENGYFRSGRNSTVVKPSERCPHIRDLRPNSGTSPNHNNLARQDSTAAKPSERCFPHNCHLRLTSGTPLNHNNLARQDSTAAKPSERCFPHIRHLRPTSGTPLR